MLNAPSLPKHCDFFPRSLSFVTLLCSSLTLLKFPCCKSHALQSVLVTLYRSMINLLPSLFSHTKPLSVSTFSPPQRADSRALYFSAIACQRGCICPHPFSPLSVGYFIPLKSFPPHPLSPAPYINVISPLSPPASRPACKTHSAGASVL